MKKVLALAALLVSSPAWAEGEHTHPHEHQEIQSIQDWIKAHDELHAGPVDPPIDPPVEPEPDPVDPPVEPDPPVDPPSNLAKYMPEAGWAQISGSKSGSVLYWPKVARADLGVEAGNALCAQILCGKADEEVGVYSGMASTPAGLFLLANGGHSSLMVSGVLFFNYETLKWERRRKPTAHFWNDQLEAVEAVRSEAYSAAFTATEGTRTVKKKAGVLAGREAVKVALAANPALASAVHQYYGRDRDGDGLNDDCLMPSGGGPMAGHTYDGQIAIPGTTKIIWMGTTAFCYRAPLHHTEMTMASQAWLYDTETDEWELLPPEFQKYVYYSSTAYDPVSGMIYLRGKEHIAAVKKSDLRKIVHSWRFRFPGAGSMLVDPDARKIYINGMGAVWEIPIKDDGLPVDTTERKVFEWASRSAYWGNQGMTLRNGDLVFWDGLNRVQVWNGVMTRYPQDCVPSRDTSAGTYSRWQYLPEHDAFIGINGTDEVLLYRLPFEPDGSNHWLASGKECVGSAEPDPVDPQPDPKPNPNPNPDPKPPGEARLIFGDTFEENGTYLAVDDESRRPTSCLSAKEAIENPNCKYRSWYWGTKGKPRKPDGPNAHLPDIPGPQIVTEADGNNAVMFTIAPYTGSGGIGGALRINFVEAMDHFLPGDRLIVEYDLKVSCTHVYTDCDPDSPDYKKVKKGYIKENGSPGLTKYSILSGGNVPGARYPNHDCDEFQIVMTGGPAHRLVGFAICGWYKGFEAGVTEPYKTIDKQPGGDNWCPYHTPPPAVPRGWGSQADSCFFIDADEWITIRQELDIRPWQPGRAGPPLTHIKVTGQYRGQPEIVVFDHNFYVKGTSTPGEGYGNLTLTPHASSKDPQDGHPEAYMWFDNIRICENECPK